MIKLLKVFFPNNNNQDRVGQQYYPLVEEKQAILFGARSWCGLGEERCIMKPQGWQPAPPQSLETPGHEACLSVCSALSFPAPEH